MTPKKKRYRRWVNGFPTRQHHIVADALTLVKHRNSLRKRIARAIRNGDQELASTLSRELAEEESEADRLEGKKR